MYFKMRITMKSIVPFLLLVIASISAVAQNKTQSTLIHKLIDKYSEAREKRDTILLKSILVPEVDQLVSTGEWRTGIGTSLKGMLASSVNAPGKRKLIVDKLRLFNEACGIVDCRYEIENPDGSIRKMWSTFIVVLVNGEWKISAIRNMLPGK
jgi:hypothetical protein